MPDTLQPISVTSATFTVTKKGHAGATLVANRAAGITFTLPTSTGDGSTYEFFVGTTISSNNLIIQVANSTDILAGVQWATQDSADTVVAFETASDSDTITMNGTTKGGIKGDRIIIKDVVSGVFHVSIFNSATGTEATAFSAAV